MMYLASAVPDQSKGENRWINTPKLSKNTQQKPPRCLPVSSGRKTESFPRSAPHCAGSKAGTKILRLAGTSMTQFPFVLSGVSGLVRAKMRLPGHRRHRAAAALRESVRDVRGIFYCLTYAHTQVSNKTSKQKRKNILGSLNYPGHPGQ